ncbi:hypothetical protein LMG7974_01260 [Campylobacter majalis]|uniref:Type II secretion system protein n=1 Tax=Campylobacter majalis TaxID=2790656 RepID=A0ABN7K8T7_9BACT|nr:type II secretion system protein [Campylobacter majalis]CAD7288949.1 hypothetical protein LMG7974_01260 [Campylobacter majalis]
MKKAFTMIELIFVIVILGILASVALPKLAATRDDAEIVKAATNINILLSDLKTYYLTRHKMQDISQVNNMTNVLPPVIIKGNACLRILHITADGVLTMDIKDDGLCAEVWKFSKFKDLKDKVLSNGGKLDLAPMSVKFNS